jgi:hypothetical protein
MYCPYTDNELEAHVLNREHIIPLSLGGSNQFVIHVDASFNSQVGSKIDGALANDFLILPRRIALDARGHSKKKPVAKNSQSTIGDEEKLVQIEFFNRDGLKVYDPVARRELEEHEFSGKKFTSRISLSRHGRLQFAAKVALAAGYFVFGDWFRENIAHHEVRALMNFHSSSKLEDFDGFSLRAYDEFTPASEEDQQQRVIDEFMCTTVKGSCVYFVPGPRNIGITVGVLSKYVATLNVPGNTDGFPFSEDNDLGHAVLVEKGKMERMSYRNFVRRAYEHLPPTNAG